MAKSIYSFQGSKVHLRMDDSLAEGYNRAMKAWFQAQEDFKWLHDRRVTPQEIMDGKLLIHSNDQDVIAYNKVCNFMNKMYDAGMKLNMEDCPSDYLEKL